MSGEILREMDHTTYNEPLVPAPGAHVVIRLDRSPGADAAATTVISSDQPFDGFPLSYEVRGDPGVLAGRDRTLIQIRIYNHPAPRAAWAIS